MTWVNVMTILLALLMITNHAGQEDIYYFAEEGNNYRAFFSNINTSEGYCLIFRSTAEENILLWNTSKPSPENFTLDANLKERLHLTWDQSSSYLKINNVTQSDSGQYKTECWTGEVLQQETHVLTVCSMIKSSAKLNPGTGEIDLQCKGAVGRSNITVQWFHQTLNRNLQPFMDDKTVRTMEDISLLQINVTRQDMGKYTCMVLEGQQCIYSECIFLTTENLFIHGTIGEVSLLPCYNSDSDDTEAWWVKDFVRIEASPSPNRFGTKITDPVKQMYVEDGRISRNYSLVIPSLKLTDLGYYTCRNADEYLKFYILLVCPKSEPITEFFSEGDEVVLRCNYNLTESDGVMWYRQTGQGDDIIMDPFSQEKGINIILPEDLIGRMNVSHLDSSLVLYNLSLKDSGQYWCTVIYDQVCVSLSKTFLLKRIPFGINSTFYRVYSTLMGCALLGMVCALITVNLKTR